MRSALAVFFFLAAAPLLVGQSPTPPAPTEPNASDLAKQTQNPVADIVSVPFQFNFNSGGAYQDQTFFNLNFQPVIPIHLTHKWTYITRYILPINSIPAGNGVSYSGIGDIQVQTFFTPAHPGKIIRGVGPAFSLPTATAYLAKTGTWAAPIHRLTGRARPLRARLALRPAFAHDGRQRPPAHQSLPLAVLC